MFRNEPAFRPVTIHLASVKPTVSMKSVFFPPPPSTLMGMVRPALSTLLSMPMRSSWPSAPLIATSLVVASGCAAKTFWLGLTISKFTPLIRKVKSLCPATAVKMKGVSAAAGGPLAARSVSVSCWVAALLETVAEGEVL